MSGEMGVWPFTISNNEHVRNEEKRLAGLDAQLL